MRAVAKHTMHRWLLRFETKAFATSVYQLSWIAKESRPKVSGTASLLSSQVNSPTVEDVMEANRARAEA